jgi:Protein kinase domain
MGTPPYMSPEQCQAVSVGIESDIYSLGVIAYEMLTGQLPFSGNMIEVIQHHVYTEAPSVRKANRRVPRPMARVVMSALAKSPDQRPANGEAFASMLRAANEGSMKLLQRAFVTYSEFFPKMLLASVILSLPTLLIVAGVIMSLALGELIPDMAGAFEAAALILVVLLAAGIIIQFPLSLAFMMRPVAQFTLAPLKPLRLREAFSSIKKRIRPLLFAVFLVSLVALPLGLFVSTAIWPVLGATALAFPAIMVERLSGWAGLRRGLSLARRVWGTLLLATLIQFGIPALIESILGLESSSVVFRILFMPLAAMMVALAYLKARQLGGEPMDEVLASFEEEENLHSAWQARLHSNLHANTITKSGVANNPNGNSRYAAPSLRAASNLTREPKE